LFAYNKFNFFIGFTRGIKKAQKANGKDAMLVERRVLAEQPINDEDQKFILSPFTGPVRLLHLAPVKIKVEPKQEADELLPFTGPLYPPVVRPLPPRLAVLPLAHNKRFTCDICKKGVGTRGGLMYHIQAHLNGRAFKCNICDKSYSTKNDYDTHNKRHVGKTFECEFCNSVFKVKQYLADHITAGHLPKSLKCKNCGKLFAMKKFLTIHLVTCDKKNAPVVGVCKFCKKNFYVSRYFQEHLDKALLMTHKCIICKAKFSCRSLYFKHKKDDNCYKTNFEIKCRVCGLKFSSEKNLNIHIHTSHSTIELKCDVCSYKTCSYKYLNTHQRRCGSLSQIRKLGFHCKPCDWYFRKNTQLEKHQIMVHGSKKCSICLHGVKGSTNMNKHVRICRKLYWPFQCKQCNVKFNKQVTFKAHINSHRLSSIGNKKFFCAICKIMYFSKLKLKQHLIRNHI